MQKVECFEDEFSNSYCSSGPSAQYSSNSAQPTTMNYGMSTTEMLLSNLNKDQWSSRSEFVEHSADLPFEFPSNLLKREDSDDTLSTHLIPLTNDGKIHLPAPPPQSHHRHSRDMLSGRNRKLHDLDRAQILKNFSLGVYTSKTMKNEEFAMLRDEKGQKVAIRCLACSAIFSPCVGGHLNYHRRNACPSSHRSQEQSRESMPRAGGLAHTPVSVAPAQLPTPQVQMLNSVARMCAMDRISPCILSAPSFRQFLQCMVDQLGSSSGGRINQMLPHPSLVWKYVRRILQSNKHSSLHHKLGQQLETCGLAISLELNAGRCLQTAHFIAEDWTLQSIPLKVFDVKNSDNLVEHVKSLLNGMNITKLELDGLVSVVVPADNCVGQGWPTVRCALEWLDWVVNTALTQASNIGPLLDHLKVVFQFLRECPMLTDDLLIKVAESTSDLRWFSQLQLIRAFQQLNTQQKAKIGKCLSSEPAPPNQLSITTKQTQIISYFDSLCHQQDTLYEVLQLFQPVVQAVDTLNNCKYPTLYKVLPLLQSLKHHFQQVQANPVCSPTVEALAQSTLELLTQESSRLLTDQHHFALILDPSEKNKIRDYIPGKEQRDQLTQSLESAVLSVHNQHKKDCLEEAANQNPLNMSDSYFDIDVAMNVVAGTDADIKKEVVSYLCTPTLPAEQMTILQFWQQSAQQFPSCARFARKVLAIPACASRLKSSWGIEPMETEQLSELTIYNTLYCI